MIDTHPVYVTTVTVVLRKLNLRDTTQTLLVSVHGNEPSGLLISLLAEGK
jgi:hypothetical protein